MSESAYDRWKTTERDYQHEDERPSDPDAERDDAYEQEQLKREPVPNAWCPNCGGLGYTVTAGTRYAHACGGDERRCQIVCPIPEPFEEQEQCPCVGKDSE